MRRTKRWQILFVALVLVAALLGEGGSTAVGAAPTRASTTEAAGEGAGTWKQVSTGYYHTCGVRTTGRLFCFGSDTRGQLGNGGANTNSAVPVEVAGNATDWKSVSAGGHVTCAIKTNGTLWCFGRDDFGQQGNGAGITADQSSPVQVGTATDWKSVSTGLGETVCGRRANKRIYCWGRDSDGQAGNGPGGFGIVHSPTAVGTNADWSSVSVGGYHVCGRRTNGRVYCWGDDFDGAVGDGGAGVDKSVPTQVAGNHADWTSVSSGITHTCGRRASGRLYCWGSDIDGGLGNGNGPGNTTSKYSPVQVSGGATDWKAVTAGSYITCATKVSGRLFCFGDDFYGQVGTGVADQVDNATPTQVTGNVTTWKPAAMGNYHTCALRTDARLFCWGYGFFGQRGDGQSGSNAPQPTPVEVV